jgi:hypothetical protein
MMTDIKCNKNIVTSNGEKLYLATFEFISGEYEQIFRKVFYAENAEDLENKMHEYLIDYYGEGNTSEVDGNDYYCWYGEIAVRQSGWEEITSFEQLVNRLL